MPLAKVAAVVLFHGAQHRLRVPMRRLAPLLLYFAAISAILVVVFLGHWNRVVHLDEISAIGGPPPPLDPSSPTGYVAGMRRHVVPGHNLEACQWIIQTQQMLHDGDWRVRRAPYDNAPIGRPVHSPSPLRWWLGAVAWLDHIRGQSLGLSVEDAALWAEPILHLLAVAGAAGLVCWRLGAVAAFVVAFLLAFSFPTAGMFQAGAPEDAALTHVTILAGLLLLLDGTARPIVASRRVFSIAGVLFAIALWLNPSVAVPIIGGVCVSGLVLGFCAGRHTGAAASLRVGLPWRWWGACGAGATLVAYVAEYGPASLAWTDPGLVEIHPLYAVAWLGAAECIHRSDSACAGSGFARGWRGWLVSGMALVALAALPAGMLFADTRGFLQPEFFSNRLTPLMEGIVADDFISLIRRDGVTRAAVGASLPGLLVLLPLGYAVHSIVRRRRAPPVVLLLGPAFVAGSFALHYLAWWGTVAVIATVIAVAQSARERTASIPRHYSAAWLAVISLPFVPGLWIAGNPLVRTGVTELSELDQQSLAERDLAHWLVQRSAPEGAIVLAPPELTVSMIYYGGARGLGSPYRENNAGFDAAVRLCAASSADEAEVLARQRSLTHIVVPSWDTFLRKYASLGTAQVQNSLIALLDSWLPPRWLRPVAYRLSPLPSFSAERVNVFEVTEVQDQALALSRLAEYFLDMRDASQAADLSRVLAEKFPEDLSVQTVIARGQLSRGERFSFARSVDTMVLHVAEGAADDLPWDRRVSLALVLAAGQKMDEAREQAGWCAETATETEVRQLPYPALFGFAKLCERFSLHIADRSVQQLMRDRLPNEAAATER